MIPNKSNWPRPNKYFLLEEGDIIKEGDEYYDPFRDEWVPVDQMYYPDGILGPITEEDMPIIEQEWGTDIKPVRRKNSEYQL